MRYVTLSLIHFCMLSSGCNAYRARVDDVPPCQGQLWLDVSWWRAAISCAGRWREAFTDCGCPRQLTSAQQETHRVFARGGQCCSEMTLPAHPFLSPSWAESFQSMKMLHNLRASGGIPDKCQDVAANLLAVCGKPNRLPWNWVLSPSAAFLILCKKQLWQNKIYLEMFNRSSDVTILDIIKMFFLNTSLIGNIFLWLSCGKNGIPQIYCRHFQSKTLIY